MKFCNSKWMWVLCLVPILLFVGLKLFYPQLAYLSFLGLLICPISMIIMMYFMNKEETNSKVIKNEK
ncbi:DUF2933 domain-containing protein [Candidatus Woesearchaeota archaeon]|nr:DUF2933 domain-containing protein [Candidatus Woesearchaeota archaeon]